MNHICRCHKMTVFGCYCFFSLCLSLPLLLSLCFFTGFNMFSWFFYIPVQIVPAMLQAMLEVLCLVQCNQPNRTMYRVFVTKKSVSILFSVCNAFLLDDFAAQKGLVPFSMLPRFGLRSKVFMRTVHGQGGNLSDHSILSL